MTTTPGERSPRAQRAWRVPTLVTCALAVVVVIMASAQGGPSYFIQLGEESTALEFARETIGPDVAVPLADGHDGESFWLLSRDPLLRNGEELAQYFDRPTYRAQRIGYPLLASPWHLGGEQALLWGLVLTNLAAAAIGTWFAGRISIDRGGPAEAAYAFACNPLVWLALLFNFSDAVALVGLVGALWAVRHHRLGSTAALSVLAALAKESSLLGLGAAAVLTRDLTWPRRAALLVPGAAAAAFWRMYVVSRPGFGTDPEVQEFSLVPFGGFEEAWRLGWSQTGDWASAVLSFALVPIAAYAAWRWWRHRGDLLLCAALPYALFVPFLSGQVLNIPVNSVRAVGPALTLVALHLVLSRAARWPVPEPVPA